MTHINDEQHGKRPLIFQKGSHVMPAAMHIAASPSAEASVDAGLGDEEEAQAVARRMNPTIDRCAVFFMASGR